MREALETLLGHPGGEVMTPLHVRISESAGFCPGVERALQLTLDAAARGSEAHLHFGPTHPQSQPWSLISRRRGSG